MEKEFILPKEVEDPFRWYVACSGKIGYLIKIGRRVLKLARKGKKRSISRELLDQAWERSRFESASVEIGMRPFHAEFNCTPDEQTIQRILRTGVELGPKEAKAKSIRGRKAALRDSMGQ